MQPIELVQQWIYQIWNAGDLANIQLFHPAEFLNEGQLSNVEEAKRWHEQQRHTFPDIAYTIDDIFEADARVVVRWTAHGTQQGQMWGFIPPTDKALRWSGMHIVRVADRQIIEVWAVANQAAVLQQIGANIVLPDA